MIQRHVALAIVLCGILHFGCSGAIETTKRFQLSQELTSWIGNYSTSACLKMSQSSVGLETSAGSRGANTSWFNLALNSELANEDVAFAAPPEQAGQCHQEATFQVWRRRADSSLAGNDADELESPYANSQSTKDTILPGSAHVRISERDGRLEVTVSMADIDGRIHHFPPMVIAAMEPPDLEYSTTPVYDRALMGTGRNDLGQYSCTFLEDQIGIRGGCSLREWTQPNRPWQGHVTVAFLDLESDAH